MSNLVIWLKENLLKTKGMKEHLNILLLSYNKYFCFKTNVQLVIMFSIFKNPPKFDFA
jgi:hypothetical protein